jgi:hypothetical protein
MKRDQSAKTGRYAMGGEVEGGGGNYRPPAVSKAFIFGYYDYKVSSMKGYFVFARTGKVYA